MPPAASAAIDLHSVRALAHKLYCQCTFGILHDSLALANTRTGQDPLSAYRPLSRSIRVLRNTLEEADEVLGDDTILPENIPVLQATVESKEVLSRLDNALSSYRCTTAEQHAPIDRHIVDFFTHIDLVTHKLSDALEAIQRSSQDNGLTLNTSLQHHSYLSTAGSPSTSTASGDYSTNMSATSSQRSFSPSHATMPNKMSSNSGCKSPVGAAESWRTPFAYFDPMSIDIAQASSMILGGEASIYPDSLGMSSSGTESSATPSLVSAGDPAKQSVGIYIAAGVERQDHSNPRPRLDRGGEFDANQRSESKLAPLEIDQTQGVDVPTSRVDSGVSWFRAASINVTSNLQSHQDHLDHSRDLLRLKLSPTGADGNAPELDLQQYNQTVHPERIWAGPAPVPPVSTIPPTAQSVQQDLPARCPTGSRASRAVQSRYRVVNLDPSTISRANSQDSKDPHTPSSPTRIRRPPPHLYSKASEPRHIAPNMDGGKIQVSDEQDMRPPIPRGSVPNSMPHRPSMRVARTEVTRSSESVDVVTLVTANEEEGVARPIAAGQVVHASNADIDPRWQRRSRERNDLDSTLTKPSPPPKSRLRSPMTPSSGDFHAISDDTVSAAEARLGREQTDSIIRLWNDGLWDQAELHITSLLARHIERNDLTMARRMRHLLGVIASIEGKWQQAVILFISVLSAPITETSQLDAGDCAAAHWLGDAYAVLGRQIEALLSYSIAERGLKSEGSLTSQLQQCIRADQESCQTGNSRSDVKLDLARKMAKSGRGDADTILDTKVIVHDTAMAYLDSVLKPPGQTADKHYSHDSNQSRANALCSLGFQSPSWQQIHKMQIDKSAFIPSSSWPLPFDPHFTMANVASGRFLTHECDLLQLPSSKVPKSAPFSRGRTKCFNCPDLRWLVLTLRECLTKLEIEWSEVANARGACFAARYQSTEDRVATTYYFTIALFRLALRPGYGVEICPDGISSARIMRSDSKFQKGVHVDENKRIKKVVRDYLDAAAKRQEAMDSRDVALPVMSINGVTSLHRGVSSRIKKPVSAGLSPISSSRGSTST